MTFWDFLCLFVDRGGIAWSLLVFAIGWIFWLIAHPSVVKEWHVEILTWIAGIQPKKRKRAFEKRLDLTIESAKTKTSESMPQFMKRFLPYELKVSWVDENETMETVTQNNQVIVYVSSYKDEARQAVGVLHNYCSIGFAEKAKLYMSAPVKEASNLIITQKMALFSGHKIYDFFNREYLPEIFKKDRKYMATYDRLKQVDLDGLFLPIFLNEIDKFANIIYPSGSSKEIENTINEFEDFIYQIATRKQGESTNLVFCKGGINIRVILAMSDSMLDTDVPVHRVEEDIKSKSINTFYVLATGLKTQYANDIATKIYERNPQDVFEPVVTRYKRYTRRPSGMDSICYEINTR